MKNTIQILSIILVIFTINSSVLIVNETQANGLNINTVDNKTVITAINPPAAIGETSTSSSSITIDAMNDDPKFWVNYLNSTVDPNEDSCQSSEDIVKQMENNPTFWVDYLKGLEN